MPQNRYDLALKAAKKEIQTLKEQGLPTVLPALDEILEGKEIKGELPLGLVDIPSELIVGTKTKGRQNSFTPSFLPTLGRESEFALKWECLWNAHLEEGIRDPIKAYEYLNKYYVLEGNKRVSILKHFDAPTIPGYVIRIIPAWEDTPEIRLYYEFLDFYNDTNINYVVFPAEGMYARLANQMGYKKHERWSERDRVEFRFMYYQFEAVFRSFAEGKTDINVAGSFLLYLEIFGQESLRSADSETIKNNIKDAWEELELHNTPSASPVSLNFDPTPVQKKGFFSQLMSSNEIVYRAAFIYNKTSQTSGWTYSHELGRLHLEDVFSNHLHTTVYDNIDTNEEAVAAMEQAIAEGNTLIFVTTPDFLPASITVAVKHPDIKIMNCTSHAKHRYIRTYYGRLFEAKYLVGMLAGVMAKDGKIGYIANYPIRGMIANINAFALGVKSVNPEAKVYLEWSTTKENEGVDLSEKFEMQGITMISSMEMVVPTENSRKYGLYCIEDGKPVNLALPIWNWGLYYEQILRNIYHGTWDSEGKENAGQAITYWWGMSSGVIDVLWSRDLRPETRHMLEGMKKAISRYDFYPFDGTIHTQEGEINLHREHAAATAEIETDARSAAGQEDQTANSHGMNPRDIMDMTWLSDNVVGHVPHITELQERYVDSVRPQAVYPEDRTE